MKEPKIIKVMEHYEAYEPDKPISKRTQEPSWRKGKAKRKGNKNLFSFFVFVF